MKKRVFIIHGWGGGPRQDWLNWLKIELEKNNLDVYVPQMPDTEHPKINQWVPYLLKIVGKPDKNTYFIGHSIGCQTIMRYLEKASDGKIGGAIFVAGWFNLTDETWDETYTKEIADEWVNTPMDFNKIKRHTDKFVLINSDNDPYVPLTDSGMFKENLGAKVIMKNNMGHISESDGVTELPIVLDELLKMAK